MAAPFITDTWGWEIPVEDDFESDHVSWLPLAGIPALISQGEISTGTTLAALLYTLMRQLPAV